MRQLLVNELEINPAQLTRVLHYDGTPITARFIADGMTLLRRPEGERKYQRVEKFPFRFLPVTTRQGELFR